MYGSLAGKNSADILVSLEYDGGEDNLHNLETATNRMTSAIRIMDNKERELKEAFKFSGKCRDWARFK